MDSCLIAKLSHYVNLTDADRTLLSSLEKEEQQVWAGEEVSGHGDLSKQLHVVKSGWLYHYTILPDGRRHIVRIHHPGDVLGLADIAYRHATNSLRSATNACICPFPKSALDSVFSQAPRLTALLFTLAVRDQVVLIDYLRATGRMSGRERVAFFLLDVLSRLRVTDHTIGDTFQLPLNQTDIGDTIGLTSVYVSKTMSQLHQSGFIDYQREKIRIRNESALAKLSDFKDRYANMDTSWFPER